MKRKIIFTSLIAFTIFYSCGGNNDNNTVKQENTKNTEQTTTIAKDVEKQEFKKLIDSKEGILIDVRTPQEYNDGHILGAKNIDINNNFILEISQLDTNTPVYVYCAAGGRSSKAMKQMTSLGFKEVYNLLGGYGDWIQE